jgi:hypothetical protein
VREASVSEILDGLDEGGLAALRGFVAAVDELADESTDPEHALAQLKNIIARTGDAQFRQALEVDSDMSSAQGMSFFFEFGQAYLAARRFGGQGPEQALETALHRLQTVDAARTFAIADTLTELAGNEIIGDIHATGFGRADARLAAGSDQSLDLGWVLRRRAAT